jgi:peptidoglycan/LPS O-acetylase OafA/YrhL
VTVQRRLAGVDALRFAAACLVMLNHTTVPWASLPAATAPIRWLAADGGTGVTLFLVLSGFSIHLRWAQRRHDGTFPVWRFWRRRFLRLYPTFWLSVPLCLGLVLLAEGQHAFVQTLHPLSGRHLAEQAVGFALIVPANLVGLVHFGRAWSLGLEEQIYVLYSAAMRRARRSRPALLVILALLVTVGFGVACQLAWPGWVPYSKGGNHRELVLGFQVPALGFAWVLGYALAEARAGALRVPSLLRRPSVALGLLATVLVVRHVSDPVLHLPAERVLVPYDALSAPLYAVGYACLVAALVLPRPRHRPRPAVVCRLWAVLAGAGLWSYSLYLVHPAVLELVDRRAGLSTWLRIPVGWAGALLVSRLFFELVERHWLLRSQRAPSPAATPEAAHAPALTRVAPIPATREAHADAGAPSGEPAPG